VKKVKIELVYKTAKGVEVAFDSDELVVKDAILIANDLQKTGRVKKMNFTDERGTDWTLKQLEKYITEIKEEPHHIKVYFDGGYDLKNKTAGLGCAIYYEQNERKYRLRKNALVEGLESNNEAEYAALHLGLKELEMLDVHHLPVTFVGDSLVVIHQLNGEWPCYEEELTTWIERIEEKIGALGITPTYEAISRKQNREADQLATQALNGVEITSEKEVN